MQQTLKISVALTLVLCPACVGDAGDRPTFEPGRATFDISPIDVTGFATDPAVRQRIVHMPFGEAAARLGSLRFHGQSSFVFNRGGERHEQLDTYNSTHDSYGNFHLLMTTPVSQVEFYLVDEEVFVRLDKGELRRKQRRGVATDAWCETAFASIRQTLGLFRPLLSFVDAKTDTVDERQVIRYRLVLIEDNQQPAQAGPPPPMAILPISPPSRWRELARPLDISGHIWIDADTGVMVKARVSGRLEISDRDVRPTQLTVSYSGEISHAGRVKAIEAPKAREEYRRLVPPRDVLSFFREHLPQETSP